MNYRHGIRGRGNKAAPTASEISDLSAVALAWHFFGSATYGGSFGDSLVGDERVELPHIHAPSGEIPRASRMMPPRSMALVAALAIRVMGFSPRPAISAHFTDGRRGRANQGAPTYSAPSSLDAVSFGDLFAPSTAGGGEGDAPVGSEWPSLPEDPWAEHRNSASLASFDPSVDGTRRPLAIRAPCPPPPPPPPPTRSGDAFQGGKSRARQRGRPD